MVGIKPVGDKTHWTEEEIDEIYNIIDDDIHHLHHHIVSVNKAVDSPVGIAQYDIVLMALCENKQSSLNDLLVAQGLAEYDPSTEQHLKNPPNLLANDDSSDSDWDEEVDVNRVNNWPNKHAEANSAPNIDDDFNFDDAIVNFEDDDLLELFPGLKNQIEKKTSTPIPLKLPTINEVDQPKVDSVEKNNLLKRIDNGYVSAETESSDASFEHHNFNHQLEYLYKRPKVCWWQTEEQLILRIGAHDNVQYGLEVTTDQLIYS